MKRKIIANLALLILILFACEKDPVDKPNPDDPKGDYHYLDTVNYTATPYELDIPSHFPKMPVPEFNKMTTEGVKLGKMLYYNPILGTNGRSCSSCHKPERSFTSPQLGPNGNAIPPHINLGWNPDFGWNAGENYLDHVAIVDLESPLFLAPLRDSVIKRFERNEIVPILFKKAYGINFFEEDWESQKLHISYALSQFMRTIIAGDSKFDRFRKGEEPLTRLESKGMGIYFSEQGDCFHCHGTILLTDNLVHNNGLDSLQDESNKGRYEITGRKEDWAKFSAPTLRNIAETAPYMHDNRFQTLEEVVDFYSEGVKVSENIDPLMKFAHQGGVQLTVEEKEALMAFLKTFSDTEFMNKPALKKPAIIFK